MLPYAIGLREISGTLIVDPSAFEVTQHEARTHVTIYELFEHELMLTCASAFTEIKSEDDLLPPGAKPGTVPTDFVQATGLERLELIGKMQGIDIFDMRPLDASRKGTIDNPIIVNGAGDEQYAGCTGFPADSHQVNWLTVSRDRPLERCNECGNVVKLNYIGPEEDAHSHDHDHGHHHPTPEEPKTFADYVKPEYWYR
ncbi:Cytochrome c oxidase subunit 4 [Penicillium herquei]|nr:Cytochrome c oxidase subunit 4 [Penicillium herquei]